MSTIIYVPELPANVIIVTDRELLVGTGQKGEKADEGLCSQEG